MAFVFSPDSVLICSAMCDMYFDFALLIAMSHSLCLSSRLVLGRSVLEGSRFLAWRHVIRSISGWSVSLLISNQAFFGLCWMTAVALAEFATMLKKSV